jgi:serine phosphatase RsbU (regulator of sigma subunit)
MPREDLFKAIFKDYFVFNKARDIVSGDFLWLKHHKNDIYLAVADCTGHGVSGAFMSVLGISLLNEEIHHIIDKGINISTGEILDNLRLRLKDALRQRSINDNKDGLDISLVKINREKKELQFSAAYNNAYLIDNTELKILEADRMPISIHLRESSFSTINIQWSGSIKLYLATDGFQDQIGEDSGRKYFTKRFRKLLMNISHLSFSEQQKYLEKELLQWKGNKKQIDDILIVGVKI